jgi:hypothetical protein
MSEPSIQERKETERTAEITSQSQAADGPLLPPPEHVLSTLEHDGKASLAPPQAVSRTLVASASHSGVRIDVDIRRRALHSGLGQTSDSA